MSKIVCDICGTSYDDTVGACPVCGWNQTGELPSDNSDFDDDDFLTDFEEMEPTIRDNTAPAEPAPAVEPVKPVKVAIDPEAMPGHRRPAQKPAKPAKPERPVKPTPKQEEEDEDDEEEEEESGSNAFLVIILVILILALLAVSAYIGWTKILKPRQMGSDVNKPQETVATDYTDAPTVETFVQTPVETVGDGTETENTAPTIPCTDISLAGNVDTLFIGQYWRLMAKATPENTTDKIVYNSSNPAVITIDEYGRVTAVGEGEAKITVTCGSQHLETNVVVKSSETDVTEAATTPAAVPAEGTSGNTTVTTPAGSTVATPTGNFALKKHDITIGRRGVYVTLEIEGGVSAESIKWSTSDSSVATVYNGNVTCIGRGVCIITAEYNGQTEQCIVRCKY